MGTVRETLDALERELVQKIAQLRHELVPLEGELADVRRAKAALAKTEEVAAAPVIGPPPRPLPSESPYRHLTMKRLAIKALKEQFPNGATANQLIEHFHNAWGRTDIKRSSLSPQLSRLKKEGDIDLSGDIWLLIPARNYEAPLEDQSGGASEDDEGGASSIESQTGSGLFD